LRNSVTATRLIDRLIKKFICIFILIMIFLLSLTVHTAVLDVPAVDDHLVATSTSTPIGSIPEVQQVVAAPLQTVALHTSPVLQEITLAQHVHQLAGKWGLSEVLLKRIIKCEAAKYPQEIEGITSPLEIDGIVYHIKLDSINHNKRNGVIWSTDYGPLMINNYYHSGSMAAKGYSFLRWEDTVAYGVELLAHEGTRHWLASAYCWDK
jgi:hypothetical protein